MAGMGPWPNDPPIRIQACPVCGGKVEIDVAGGVRIGAGPEQWSESGRCRRCKTNLVRALGDTERPVIFMSRADWHPSPRHPYTDRPMSPVERSALRRKSRTTMRSRLDNGRGGVLLALRLCASLLAWGLSVLATHFLLEVRPWRSSILIGLVPFVLIVLFAQPAGRSDED